MAGSQRYPIPFGLILPTTANFIALVGLPGFRTFLHEVVASFRRHTAFPSIGGVAPDALVPGIGWSDHWAFPSFGYPAVMVTDTALFRYPHYHLPSDTPDKVDYQRLARVTKGVGTGGARDCPLSCGCWGDHSPADTTNRAWLFLAESRKMSDTTCARRGSST
jgi:hypothetical protein